MSNVPSKLNVLAQNCKLSDFYCDNNSCTNAFNVCTTTGDHDGEYSWSVKMQCAVFSSIWWLCSSCNLRNKITKVSALQHHQYAYHNKHIQQSSIKTKRYR